MSRNTTLYGIDRNAQPHNAPRGQTVIAQGNALGHGGPHKRTSPNGPTGRTHASIMLPRWAVGASVRWGVANPGRCPGLSAFLPLAQRPKRRYAKRKLTRGRPPFSPFSPVKARGRRGAKRLWVFSIRRINRYCCMVYFSMNSTTGVGSSSPCGWWPTPGLCMTSKTPPNSL